MPMTPRSWSPCCRPWWCGPDPPSSWAGWCALCNDHGLPLTVRGAGTNLSGGTIPHAGGVVVLTNALNQILEINEADLYAVVQPGVVTAKLAQAVEAKGLFYPPDPGSMAVSTLGGNVAENAGGLRGLKYGVTLDYIMGLEFFSAAGDTVKTGSRTVKCVTGYNLTGLLVGSEGTLGVHLGDHPEAHSPAPGPAGHAGHLRRTWPRPRRPWPPSSPTASSRPPWNSWTTSPSAPSRITATPACRWTPRPCCSSRWTATPRWWRRRPRRWRPSAASRAPPQVHAAKDDAERDRVWSARRAALSALAKLKPTVVLEDATVPRSKIPAMIRAIEEISQRFDLPIGTFGHAGDGNLHPTILTDRRNQQEWHRVEAAVDAIFDAALGLGGTLSGEHGIGTGQGPLHGKRGGPRHHPVLQAHQGGPGPEEHLQSRQEHWGVMELSAISGQLSA